MDSSEKLDNLILGPQVTPDGGRAFVRHNEKGVCSGVLRPIKQGMPMYGEAVHLQRIEGNLYNVREYLPTTDNPETSGPVMVNSEEYRTGWDSIFGDKKSVAEA
jgi:hypothetical protein